MRTVQSDITRFTLRDDGIVTAIAIEPDTPRDRATMEGNLDALESLVAGTPRPVLWDPRVVRGFHPDAWRVIIRRSPPLVVAAAILVDDETEERLGAYPTAIGSLLFPMATFRSEEEAIDWLQAFVD